MSSIGYAYVSTAAGTDIATISTYQKAAGTTTLENSTADVTMPASNRLQYDGGVTKPFSAEVSASVDISASHPLVTSANVTLALAVNGVVDESTAMGSYIAKNSPKVVKLTSVLELDDGDYVEVWAKCDQLTDVILEAMTFTMEAV